MDGNEDDVAGLKPRVVGAVRAKEIVVEIERVDEFSAAANLDAPHATVERPTAGGIERRQCCPGARDAIAPGFGDVTEHIV